MLHMHIIPRLSEIHGPWTPPCITRMHKTRQRLMQAFPPSGFTSNLPLVRPVSHWGNTQLEDLEHTKTVVTLLVLGTSTVPMSTAKPRTYVDHKVRPHNPPAHGQRAHGVLHVRPRACAHNVIQVPQGHCGVPASRGHVPEDNTEQCSIPLMGQECFFLLTTSGSNKSSSRCGMGFAASQQQTTSNRGAI